MALSLSTISAQLNPPNVYQYQPKFHAGDSYRTHRYQANIPTDTDIRILLIDN